jgi:hypothetical protein
MVILRILLLPNSVILLSQLVKSDLSLVVAPITAAGGRFFDGGMVVMIFLLR